MLLQQPGGTGLEDRVVCLQSVKVCNCSWLAC